MSNVTFWFVVDTNLYAGNNVHTLAAWMTGLDSGFHGREEAVAFREAGLRLPDDLVVCLPDERNIPSPSAMTSTPQLPRREVMGHALEEVCSVAIRLSRMPTPGEQAFLIARARSFTGWRKCGAGDPEAKILGFRIETETRVRASSPVVVDEEAVLVAAAKIKLAEAK